MADQRNEPEQQPITDQETKQELTKVVQFYKGANVLITGASGFLGKVILWKLLESCDTQTIYVLIRSKHTQSAQKRLVQMLKSKPFSFKHDYNQLLEKVVAIESDMTEEGLGLSQTDRTLLEDKVNVVIHSAASVKFDAPLKDNLRDNVYGTCSILALANNMRNLKSFVHVSTAYSNCHLKDIKEDLVPLERDIDDVVKTIKTLPDKACERVTKYLLEGRPNTYTYTKAIAEHYVAREQGKFPISIVRPSIVIPSFKEPCPGWVDNVNGICGLGCLGAVGLLRTIDWNYYSTSDMVPVDYVANCIICAAPQAYQTSPNKILIYNMTSGDSNPISWGEFFGMLRKEAVKTPSNKIVRPIIEAPKHKRANPYTFLMIRYFSELLFAYSVDVILTLIGYKKVLVKITQKMHAGYRILLPFTTNEWKFRSQNLNNMSDNLDEKEKQVFKFDMRDFNWKQQAYYTWMGGRSLLLKEEPSEESIKSAKMRQNIVNIIHYGSIVAFGLAAAFASANLVKVF